MEEWRSVIGYEGHYSVSNEGRIKSEHGRWGKKKPIILRSESNFEYLTVVLSKDGKRKWLKVHLLVARSFIGEVPPDHECNHIDFNKHNNNASNLEYLTHGSNIKHAYQNGFISGLRGTNHWNNKLTENQVLEIRRKYSNGGTSYNILGKEYGVTLSSIAYIIKRKTWKYI